MFDLASHTIRRSKLWTPHYYQKEAVRRTEASWDMDEWDRSLIVIPTGGGKTKVTGELCARTIEQGSRALFLAHTKGLVEQPKSAFEEDFGCQATIEMAEQKADDSPMVFASVQTMVNRIKKGLWRPDTFGVIIMDEAHRTLAAGHSLVVKHFGQSGAKIAGCTATPRRGDKKDLLKFYDGISYDKPIQELFAEGFLIEPTIVQVPLGLVVKHEKKGEITDEEIGHAIEPYLDAAADAVMRVADGRCGLSFLPLRSTARAFCAKLCARGLKAEYVGGDLSDDLQKRIKHRLIMGQIDHVCNAQIWGEGVDIRPCNLLVDLRPTLSWTSAMQKWGRITRTYDPDAPYAPKGARWGLKTDACLMDFCFESNHHSMIQRPAVMVAKDEEEEKLVTKALAKKGGGSLMQALKAATNEREETLRLRLEAMSSRSAKTISAMSLFLGQHRMDLVDYEPMTRRESLPPTEDQLANLERAGISPTSILTRGHAHRAMELVIERRNKGLATAPQANYCAILGHPDPWSLTFEAAGRFIDTHKSRR